MLLSVLLISSAVLGAATIAGLLVSFQLRQTADAEASAQAVFAADAGIEKALYEKYKIYKSLEFPCVEISSNSNNEDQFVIGAGEGRSIEYMVAFQRNIDGECVIAQSGGRSGRSTRAFILYFEGIENFGDQFIE